MPLTGSVAEAITRDVREFGRMFYSRSDPLDASLLHLFRNIHRGNLSAYTTAIEGYSSLVDSIASSFSLRQFAMKRGLDHDDLMQEGFCVLPTLLCEYNLAYKVRFPQFVFQRIHGAMYDAVRRSACFISSDFDFFSSSDLSSLTSASLSEFCTAVRDFLPSSDYRILSLHFGLEHLRPYSFLEIATLFGVRTTCIESRYYAALRTLRHHRELFTAYRNTG